MSSAWNCTQPGTNGTMSGGRKQRPRGREPISEAADWLLGCQGPIKKYSYQLQPAPLLQLIAELLQAWEIWHLVNWWEGRMATARYAVQKLQVRRRTSGEGGTVTAPIKGTYHERVNFLSYCWTCCVWNIADHPTLGHLNGFGLTVPDPFNMGGISFRRIYDHCQRRYKAERSQQ